MLLANAHEAKIKTRPFSSPTSSKCFFINESGEFFPEWLEAFPQAKFATPKRVIDADKAIIWLRTGAHDNLKFLLPGILQLNPKLPLVVLADEPDEASAFSAISLGAAGYCHSHTAPDVLLTIAHVVSSGGLWLGQTIMCKVLQSLCDCLDNKAGTESKLPDDEIRLASLLLHGASHDQIARQLQIPESAVAQTTSALFARQGVQGRLQLLIKTLVS